MYTYMYLVNTKISRSHQTKCLSSDFFFSQGTFIPHVKHRFCMHLIGFVTSYSYMTTSEKGLHLLYKPPGRHT